MVSAAFSAYDTVQVDGTRRCPATGSSSRPAREPRSRRSPGWPSAGYLDADSIWSLSSLPKSLTVMTTEPVGIEFAQCFARLGSKVTVLAESAAILAAATTRKPRRCSRSS